MSEATEVAVATAAIVGGLVQVAAWVVGHAARIIAELFLDWAKGIPEL